MTTSAMPRERKPEWIKVRFPAGDNFHRVKGLMRRYNLNTVCEEAHCPNIGECFNRGTATFMILGDTCTRACGFCAVTSGRPDAMDELEPERLAASVKLLSLRYVVITAVNRDDQPDGGAHIFARCIERIREDSPECAVEVLTPDFMGNWDALETVVRARPRVYNHNIETVPRLYPTVRFKARYERSLELLARVKAIDPDMLTKSGIMLGLGEEIDEVREVLSDLRAHEVDLVTIGQYLRPSDKHLPMRRYVRPEEFAALADDARALGFRHVESGPLVRSSYHADEQAGMPFKQFGAPELVPLEAAG
jgi:lipoic acid synthetase